MREKTSQSSP
jgi:hypothetical protein